MPNTVVSYIPALHQGYLTFFAQYPDELFVLGKDFVLEAPRMERDIRAIDPETISKMIEALGVLKSVRVLSQKSLVLLKQADTIVMPDEDVNHVFADKHLKGLKVQFVPVFLRWDRQISTTEFIVPPDRTISTDHRDKELINLTKQEAKKSPDWWRQIGALVCKNGEITLQGHNRPLAKDDYSMGTFGDPRSNFDYGEYFELTTALHAEAGIISEAAKRGIALEGTSLYVSTFPCPGCAKLVAAAGIRKIYYDRGYSMLDAEDILRAHNIEIILVDTKNPLS